MRKKETALLTEERLNELYLIKNLTVKEIAEEFNIGTATVNRLLKNYNIKKSEMQRRSAISKTKQNKTEEEKLLYSKHVSEARKGKGLGVTPWNKGTKGLQVAWNKGISTPGRPRSSESLEKARQTCLERYGVEWACQRQEARLKGQNSGANIEFEKLLQENNINYEREFPIGSYSYDFKVGNYLVEINPYATHNSTWGIRNNPPKSASYHKQKSNIAKEKGYVCVHKFDWDAPDRLIKTLLLPKRRLYARNCIVQEVDKQEASSFISKHHLQGNVKDRIRLGLYFNDELISIMTFGTPRYNKKYEYELIRYCYSANIVGGAEKLFKYFINKYEVKSVVSYCDLSKFTGKVYNTLGFKLLRNSAPSKHWYHPKTYQHYTDTLIRQQGFSRIINNKNADEDNLATSDNNMLMLEAGFVEIYDCGQATYVWNKPEEV